MCMVHLAIGREMTKLYCTYLHYICWGKNLYVRMYIQICVCVCVHVHVCVYVRMYLFILQSCQCIEFMVAIVA